MAHATVLLLCAVMNALSDRPYTPLIGARALRHAAAPAALSSSLACCRASAYRLSIQMRAHRSFVANATAEQAPGWN